VYLDTVLLVGSVGAQQPSGLRPAFLAGACTASLGWFASLGFGARMLAPVFARPAAWRVLDALVALIMWTVAITLALKTF
jgi:L-lysine exporter family protein LysE/ArgO